VNVPILNVEIRLADVVDMLLVTVMVYTAVVWIRRTRASLVAIGILILGAVSLAARALGLQLTAWMLQGFFAVFVIIVVVIFQEELRQLFERLAVWSLRRRQSGGPLFDPRDILVTCLADFARDRIGALIVLPGNQPVQRHLHGGIELNGRLSVPLLKSIFDPHSAGHDGALIIEGDRVTRFAVHLPLSTDARQLGGMGTRHSAALGLAELTDALCLVVSEERGRVAVAKDGTLRALATPHDLGAILEQFRQAQQPSGAAPRAWAHAIRQNWAEKLASIVIVITLWYLFVPGSRPTQVTYDVPVTVRNVPADYVIEDVSPERVEITLAGATRAFYLLDPHSLGVDVDASPAKLGRRTFQISDQNVMHPKDLSLESIRPSSVRISVRRVAKDHQ
jgi:diadenylate cyclase